MRISCPHIWIQNIGLYAMDGEREILFAVSQAQVPDQVPAYNGVAPSSFIFNLCLAVAQAAEIRVDRGSGRGP